MDVATDTPIEQPAVVETSSTPAEDSGSLADHEASFGPAAKRPTTAPPVAADDAPEGERNARGQFVKPPHRAQSQKAGAGDVDAIQAQTARLRQAEKDAGITAPDRTPGESDRAYNLRRQADIVEALRDARKATSPTPQNGSSTRQEMVAPPPARKAVEFDKPRPKADQFASADDPAEAYIEALADWRFDKRIHDAQQIALANREQQSYVQAIEQGKQTETKINAKIAEFLKEKPDYWQRMDEVEHLKVPDVALHAISLDDNPPKLTYHLATHRRDLLNLVAFARNLDLSQDSVELVKEYLVDVHSQILDAGETPTGAPASATPVIVAPRPPTPVRTGPLKTGDEPPGDDSSLADHERYYAPKRR